MTATEDTNMQSPDELIDAVVKGEDPDKLLLDAINPKNLGSTSGDGDPNPHGGVDNTIQLVNPGEAASAKAMLDKANIRVSDHGNGILGLDYNSARDSAAQLLSTSGIQVRVSG